MSLDADLAVRHAINATALNWLTAYTPASVPAGYAPYHARLASWPDPGDRQARVVFRGAAKSTVTIGMVLWAIHTGRTQGVVLVRAIEADVIADRDAIIRLGAMAGMRVVPQGNQQMVVVNGVPVWLKTPRGAVRGLRYVTPGGATIRPDTVVIDDVETRETARSHVQTDRLGRWMQADLFATAGHNQPLRVVMLGTPITPTSLIARAMRREPPFDTWLPPLVVPYVDADGVPAWGEMFNPNLEEQTEDGAWANEYLLDPLPEGSLMFPPARTRWAPDGDVPPLALRVAVDPADEGADATGIVACGQTHQGLVFVDAVQWNGPGEEGPYKVAELCRRVTEQGHHVTGVHVEAVGAWRWYASKVAELVAPLDVWHEKPILSKTERGLPLARWQKMGAVWMVDSLRGSPLDVEFHTWTREGFTVTGHDDMIDAAVWAAGAATLGWSQDPPSGTVDT